MNKLIKWGQGNRQGNHEKAGVPTVPGSEGLLKDVDHAIKEAKNGLPGYDRKPLRVVEVKECVPFGPRMKWRKTSTVP